MTEREGPGGTRENVRDDLDEAAKGRKKDAKDAAEKTEGKAEGGGGVKDNVADDQRKTQE